MQTPTFPTRPDPIRAARLELATELEMLPDAARVRVVRAEVTRTGGTLIPPRQGGAWGSHWAELSLLGVSNAGDDEATAIVGWIKAVLRMEAEDEQDTYAQRLCAAIREVAA